MSFRGHSPCSTDCTWCFSTSTISLIECEHQRSNIQVLHRHECGELQYASCTRSFHRTEKEYGYRKYNSGSESTCTSTLRRSRKGKVASSLDIEQIGFVSFYILHMYKFIAHQHVHHLHLHPLWNATIPSFHSNALHSNHTHVLVPPLHPSKGWLKSDPHIHNTLPHHMLYNDASSW